MEDTDRVLKSDGFRATKEGARAPLTRKFVDWQHDVLGDLLAAYVDAPDPAGLIKLLVEAYGWTPETTKFTIGRREYVGMNAVTAYTHNDDKSQTRLSVSLRDDGDLSVDWRNWRKH